MQRPVYNPPYNQRMHTDGGGKVYSGWSIKRRRRVILSVI